jgi:hypothetical protein
MSMTYTFGQTISTAGITGMFNALHNNTTSPIIVTVTPVRNEANTTVTVSVPAGGVLPLKVKHAKPNSTGIVGLS